MDQFEYMDESSVDDTLKCDICKKPFFNPILLPCKKTFCRKCIENNLNIHTDDCSQCDESILQSGNLDVGNPIVEIMLNKILVKCLRCTQDNIQRKDVFKHAEEICPKKVVVCTANDLECSWEGSYDRLNEHVDQCVHEKLRTLLTDLFKDRQDLQELKNQFTQQKTHIDQIENENRTLADETNVLKTTNQSLTDEIAILKADNQTLIQLTDDFKKLENDHNQLLEQSKKQTEQIDTLTSETNDLTKNSQQEINDLKTETNRLQQIEVENQQLKDNLIEFDLLKNACKIFQEKDKYFHNLEINYQELHTSFDDLRNQYEELLVELNRLMTTSESERNLLEEFRNENNLYREQINDLQIIEKSYYDLRKKSHHDEIQIEKFAIELKRFEKAECFQEIDETNFQFEDNYENIHLKRFLDKCQIDSMINLNGEKLNDNDMNIVIKTGLVTKACHSLILSSNHLSLNSIKNLSIHLNINQTLRKLILTNNQLSDSAVQCLADCLAFDNRTLEVLNLSSNQMNDQCLIYLSNMLKSNQTIRSIGLHENQLTDQSIEYLSKVMQLFNRTLEDISLYSNRFITDASIESIYDMIKKNQSLKILWIWDCQLSQQGKQQIQQAVQEKILFDLQI